jgi:hypothetical protein
MSSYRKYTGLDFVIDFSDLEILIDFYSIQSANNCTYIEILFVYIETGHEAVKVLALMNQIQIVVQYINAIIFSAKEKKLIIFGNSQNPFQNPLDLLVFGEILNLVFFDM